MSPVVWIGIEHRKARSVPRDHVVYIILIGLRNSPEKRLFGARRLRRQNVLDPPRGVEIFHEAKLEGRAENVKVCDEYASACHVEYSTVKLHK